MLISNVPACIQICSMRCFSVIALISMLTLHAPLICSLLLSN